MTLDEAVSKLEEVGFVVERMRAPEPRILGGTSRVDDDGQYVYAGAFSIYPHQGRWTLTISGPDYNESAFEASSLEEAVDEACRRLLQER